MENVMKPCDYTVLWELPFFTNGRQGSKQGSRSKSADKSTKAQAEIQNPKKSKVQKPKKGKNMMTWRRTKGARGRGDDWAHEGGEDNDTQVITRRESYFILQDTRTLKIKQVTLEMKAGKKVETQTQEWTREKLTKD